MFKKNTKSKENLTKLNYLEKKIFETKKKFINILVKIVVFSLKKKI